MTAALPNASKLELRGGRVAIPSATAKLRIMEILAPFGVSYSPTLGQISGLFKLLPAPADRLRLC